MKRFEFITEADARLLEIGSTVHLATHGQITPLARDTLKERRVTVVIEDLPDDDQRSLVPAADVRRVVIGSDHTGVSLKAVLVAHLRAQGRQVQDVGTNGPESVDYPDIAALVARTVACGEADGGIVIDGAGIGSAMAANKIDGIRAAMCADATIARYAREHNGANVMTLGSVLLTTDQAKEIVDVWLATSMREPRYVRRLEKIRRLERER